MNGRKTGTFSAVGCGAAPLRPVEEGKVWRIDPVPDLLDRVDVEAEGLRQRRLGEPGGDSDPELPGRQLEQSVAAAGVEMVEHPRQRAGRLGAAQGLQPLDDGGDAQGPVVDLGGLVDPLRPEQGHRLGHVADIIPAHSEEDGIDPFLDDRPDRRRLDPGQVELAGQGRQRIAAVGIGRAAEIVADQLQLAVARAGVDEAVEELGEVAHGVPNGWADPRCRDGSPSARSKRQRTRAR